MLLLILALDVTYTPRSPLVLGFVQSVDQEVVIRVNGPALVSPGQSVGILRDGLVIAMGRVRRIEKNAYSLRLTRGRLSEIHIDDIATTSP